MVGKLLGSKVSLFHLQTLLLWTLRPSTVVVATWQLLPAPTWHQMTKLMMKLTWSRHLHCDCCQFAHFQAETPGTVHDVEATLQSVLEHPSLARTCVFGWPGLSGQGLGGHLGCDEMECAGVTLLLLLHPEGPRRCKWPLCLCSCSWLPRRAQGWGAGGWHPMSGGVLGKRERRGPTHTLLTVLWPPAPKNIAFNWQGGKDFTGPWKTSLGQDRSSSSSWIIFSLRKEKREKEKKKQEKQSVQQISFRQSAQKI